MTNAYQQAISANGFTIVNGIKYAIGRQPYIENLNDGVAYQSYGFTQTMLGDNGQHDPLFDESVKIAWVCTHWYNTDSGEEFECDWESCAILA